MAKLPIEKRERWRRWVTPKPLAQVPIYRWCIFPHSFSGELIRALVEEWNLGAEDHIADPFAGAGTTILAAKEKGIPATGYDISPLAVLASRVKICNYNIARLEKAWGTLHRKIELGKWGSATKDYSELVRKALPGRLLDIFEGIDRDIANLDASLAERDFFRLALLTTLPRYSHAIATGGWLSWVGRRNKISKIPRDFSMRVQLMLKDLNESTLPRRAFWRVEEADARTLPDKSGTYSAVISSPPYPNRHDYTRVFGVELMFGFLNWEGTRKLRYQSFHSHPEARPDRPESSGYTRPTRLSQTLRKIRKETKEERVSAMLAGYFLDMYLCLKEVRRICKKNARIGFVVGNAQYYGHPVLSDELTAELGEQAGLTCVSLVVARIRGNSAQQMAKYGRIPSRETVVIFKKP